MRQWLFVAIAILWLGMAHAATLTTAVLHPANMTCPSCSVTIERALSRVAGVTNTQVDLKAGTVTVAFDAERTAIPVLARVITDAGFPGTVKDRGG